MGKIASLWQAQAKMPVREALNRPLDVDVCIIGAGIAGLTCAYLLSKKGKKVAVLEARELGVGETARTTAHITSVLDSRYVEIEELFGSVGSQLIAESHTAAINFIESMCLQESISCQFERLPAYLYLANNEDNSLLEKELEAATRAGLDASMISRAPLPFDTGLSLQFARQAQFHPLRYLNGLIEAIERLGGEIYTHTRAKQILDGTQTRVITTEGHLVTARAVIVATNSPVNNRFIIHTKQASYRTYVMAFAVPQQSVSKGLYYDTHGPYHYVRLADSENADQETLIIGGEDHRTGQNSHPELCYETLEKWARKKFPMAGEVLHKWSGQVVEPVDTLAFLGHNPMDKNIYVVTGESGNGMTNSTLGSLVITDLILGVDNPWASLFTPARKSPKAFKRFLEENLNTAAQYRDWLITASHSTIPAGSGAIVQDGMKKTAVYRDEQNNLHRLSAVCPHLGGIVRWNEAEKTWDCPCHGSRFSSCGKVLNGPANTNLTEL